jgi:hypothetical protein
MNPAALIYWAGLFTLLLILLLVYGLKNAEQDPEEVTDELPQEGDLEGLRPRESQFPPEYVIEARRKAWSEVDRRKA